MKTRTCYEKHKNCNGSTCNQSPQELIVWGLPRGQTDAIHQAILSTQCRNSQDVERIKAAASRDGWHSFRVQVLDGSKPDFAACVRV